MPSGMPNPHTVVPWMCICGLLRSFIAVAEELSVTRAAARLHITQPALSRQIHQLEADLGVPLFAREPHGLRLSDAGEVLLQRTPALLSGWDSAAVAARATTSALRVGFTAATTSDLARTAAAAFGASHPGWRIVTTQLSWADPTALLRSRAVDVTLLRHPVPDLDLVRIAELRHEPRVLALPEQHHLARQEEVDLSDLLDETFVPLPAGPWRDYWLCVEERHGHPAQLADPVNGPEEWAAAIIAGRGIAITAASTATYYARPGMVFRPVRGITPSIVYAAWRRDDHRADVQQFIAACQTAARPAAPAETRAPAESGRRSTAGLFTARPPESSGTLVLRLAVSAEADTVQQQLLGAYSAAAPATPVALTATASTSSRVDAVLGRRVDAALARVRRSPHPDLDYQRLDRTPLLLAVPQQHPLNVLGTAADAVPLRYLDGEPLAFYDRAQNPWWYDDVLDLLAGHGAQPRIVHRGLWAYDVLPIVAAGAAVALIGRDTAAAVALPGITYLRLRPQPTIDLGLLWRHDHQPSHLERLLTLASTLSPGSAENEQSRGHGVAVLHELRRAGQDRGGQD